ncbi:hypothetical protein [Histidinibacterium lentulum]|uniref:Dihydroxy-acid dehydratase n=1 Tax=Histidinibacterium lentulum TaxID=2480588 RepID=A0A3N2QRB3_9RHOB|nr:hypothetical protein [Histidinibacterium lentulum]ROT97734.1 hypothetical protein EAT49_18170 [Histidinibacterium lentulum]
MTRSAVGLALAAGLALSGCGAPVPATSPEASPTSAPDPGGGLLAFLGMAPAGRESLQVLGDAVTVRGPAGYCVDPGASAPDRGFAVLASCARTGRGDPVRLDALMTVQVGAPGSAMGDTGARELAALLEGPEGRGLLAQGVPVRVTEVQTAPGTVFVGYSEAREAAGGPPPPLWRAFLDLGDRMATVSIRPVDGAVLSSDAERRLIGEAVAQLRAANRPG